MADVWPLTWRSFFISGFFAHVFSVKAVTWPRLITTATFALRPTLLLPFVTSGSCLAFGQMTTWLVPIPDTCCPVCSCSCDGFGYSFSVFLRISSMFFEPVPLPRVSPVSIKPFPLSPWSTLCVTSRWSSCLTPEPADLSSMSPATMSSSSRRFSTRRLSSSRNSCQDTSWWARPLKINGGLIAVILVHTGDMSKSSRRLTSNRSESHLICLSSLSSLLEYKPKQAHPAAQILRTILRSGRGQKYPDCGHEQSPSSDHPHAH